MTSRDGYKNTPYEGLQQEHLTSDDQTNDWQARSSVANQHTQKSGKYA